MLVALVMITFMPNMCLEIVQVLADRDLMMQVQVAVAAYQMSLK